MTIDLRIFGGAMAAVLVDPQGGRSWQDRLRPGAPGRRSGAGDATQSPQEDRWFGSLAATSQP